MKPFALLIVGVVVGWAASGVDWSREAVGQETDSITGKPINSFNVGAPRRVFETRMEVDANGQQRPVTMSRLVNADGTIVPETPPGLIGRYQASAYGSPNGHGCYVVDTMTGKTWHLLNGHPPLVVAEALSPRDGQPTMPVPTPAYNQPAEPAEPYPTATE